MIQEELVTTVGDEACGRSKIKIWLQKFKINDFSCNDLPRDARSPLTLRPQLEALFQKYPFASACGIAQHFLTTVLMFNDILQREVGMQKFAGRAVSHLLSDAQYVTHEKPRTRC
jgi:hypothetical protein